ncbi:hypothetical protein ACIDI_6c00020 [Acidiphilium sp. JA12-A1]|nr:hypothetical protein ACIDI_6c00020 [Acidiphilium sp. JA12-A1]
MEQALPNNPLGQTNPIAAFTYTGNLYLLILVRR